MTNDEQKNNLCVLVELKLYKFLQVIQENIKTGENLEANQTRTIINFINSLPDTYKSIPERDKIIAESLEKMDMHTVWAQKKLEELSNNTSQKQTDTISKEQQENQSLEEK